MDAFRISHAIMDGYCIRILRGLSEKPATCSELSTRFDIPIAACYRRVHMLRGLGLVQGEVQGLARNGKPRVSYRSRLRSIRVSLEGERLLVHLEIQGSRGARPPMLFEVARSPDSAAASWVAQVSPRRAADPRIP